MDWGSVIGGIGSAAGSLGDLFTGGYFSRKAWQRQKEAMQSAHQWEVADLRKAGLNPILSATGGSGASTGGLNGSMVGDTQQFSRAVSNAFQGAQLSNILDQQKANIKATEADTDLKKQQAEVQEAVRRLTDRQTQIAAENAHQLWRENEWWRQNRTAFNASMGYKAVPTLPYGSAALMGILSGSSNSKQYWEDEAALWEHKEKNYWKDRR